MTVQSIFARERIDMPRGRRRKHRDTDERLIHVRIFLAAEAVAA